MNQIKIGRFIAERRKQEHLTQAALAESLGITDKAVSKWERGIAMPDTAIMLDLCEILGISVNELLSGEKTTMENNNEKNEQLLLELSRELEEKNKKPPDSFKNIFYSLFVFHLITALYPRP